MIRFTNEEFTQLITYMSGQYGIDLSKKKILAECRMNGELEKRGNISMGEYMRQMEMDRTKQLESILLNRLTTNYTYFMREPKHFDFLREKILPNIKPEWGAYRIRSGALAAPAAKSATRWRCFCRTIRIRAGGSHPSPLWERIFRSRRWPWPEGEIPGPGAGEYSGIVAAEISIHGRGGNFV